MKFGFSSLLIESSGNGYKFIPFDHILLTIRNKFIPDLKRLLLWM